METIKFAKKNAPFIYAGDGLIENQRPENGGQVFDFAWRGKYTGIYGLD